MLKVLFKLWLMRLHRGPSEEGVCICMYMCNKLFIKCTSATETYNTFDTDHRQPKREMGGNN